MRQYLIGLLLCLGLALGLSAQARAQEPPPASGLTLLAEAAFGGTVKYGEWLPIHVTLENSGAAVSGRVQVRSGGTNATQHYAQNVEMPSGARKQVTLYVTPTNFARRLTVEFVAPSSEGAIASGELSLRPVPNIRYVIALIGAEDGGVRPLATESFRQQTRAETTLVAQPLATLPDRAETLRSLDLIILSGVDTTPLSATQRVALEQYVAQGGVLAVGGGASAARVMAGLPETIRPVTLAGEESVAALPALAAPGGEEVRVQGPFVAARATPVDGALVRVEQEGLPLVVERAVGRGAVLWFALDPALSPFDAWAGTGAFWKTLVGARAYYPTEMPEDMSARQTVGEQLGYALQNLPSLDLPSLRLLVPLLALYILAVGPLTYFVLRRQRRLELAWVAIPLLTLLFSGAAYLLGFQLRGNDLIVNRISLVRVVPGSGGGSVQSMIGLFSPSRRTYTMEVAGGNPLLSPSVQSDPFGPSTGLGVAGQAIYMQGEPALVQDLVVNQWSLRAVMAESRLSEGFEVAGEASLAEGTLRGTLDNESAQRWEEVVVLLGDQYDRLGPINPGESRPFSVRLASDSVNQVTFRDLSWEIFGDQTGGMPERQDQVRQQILSTLLNSSIVRDGGSREPIFLIWTSEPPLDVVVDGTPITGGPATTLIYGTLPTRFETGRVTVPRGFAAGRIVSNDGSSCWNPGLVSLSPDFREAVIEFALPSSLRTMTVEEATLMLLTDESALFSTPGIELRDAASGEWVPLESVNRGRNVIADAGRYFTDARTLQLRVTSERANQNGCLYFDLSLRGTTAALPQSQP